MLGCGGGGWAESSRDRGISDGERYATARGYLPEEEATVGEAGTAGLAPAAEGDEGVEPFCRG